MINAIRVRLDSGERRILPTTATAGARAGSNRRRWTGGIAAAALFGAFWMFRVPEPLVAGVLDGELRVVTAHPRAGSNLEIEYIAPQALSAERELHVRALFRRPIDSEYDDATEYKRVAVLRRARDGRYRGAFMLPESVVYAALAIENGEASRVDSRKTRYWEVLTHTAAGIPSSPAFEQQVNDLHGRNMEAALGAAREWTRWHQDEPEAWSTLAYLEKLNLGTSADAFRVAHRARALAFHAKYSTLANPSPLLIDAMRGYLSNLASDSLTRPVRAHWIAAMRQARDDDAKRDVISSDITVSSWKLSDLNDRAYAHPESASLYIEDVEALWQRNPVPTEYFLRFAPQIAGFANDGDAHMLRWADRVAAVKRKGAEWAYQRIASRPALRQTAITRLDSIVRHLLSLDDSRRPLEMTRREAARRDSAQAGQVLTQLAAAYLAGGDSTNARIALLRATSISWDRKSAVAAIRLFSAADKSPQLAQLLATVHVDPGTPEPTADSMGVEGGKRFGSEWTSAVRNARVRMRDYFLDDAIREPLSGALMVRSVSGDSTSLRALSAGAPTVVMFWSQYCVYSLDALKQMDQLAAQLRRHGARLVVVATSEPDDADTKRVLQEAKLAAPVYYDVNRDVSRTFRLWSTPSYHVLDAQGVLRFRSSAVDRVVSQAIALQFE